MVTTRRGNGSRPEVSNDTEIPDLWEIVTAEVREVIQELLPGMFAQMKSELLQNVEEKIAAASRSTHGQGQPRWCSYKDFYACHPPEFKGKKDPIVSNRWIAEVEGAFRTSFCPPESKVIYASNLLKLAANDWWGLIMKSGVDIEKMTWEEFKILFKGEYAPTIEVERVTKEFLALQQTTESVNEITAKFYEKALFCPDYAATEEMKMSRYVGMLKTEIREFVVTARCKTMKDMMEVARIREIELETQGIKRKQVHAQAPSRPNKMFKPSGGKTEDKRSLSKCNKCGNNHPGECWWSSRVCSRCGKTGHRTNDCKQEPSKLCFGCNQFGHIKSQCPNITGQTVQAPAPATLRITDGRQKKPEATKTRPIVYQLTTEEAKAVPDVVAGIIPIQCGHIIH